jgi:hypothetical protein
MSTIIGLELKQNNALMSLPVFIQCTWVRVFLTPTVIKLNAIISYDRGLLFSQKLANSTAKKNQIGKLTGYYVIDEKNVVWLDIMLFYCNRESRGWVRESDIWHKLKGCEPNKNDWPYIPYTPKIEPDPNEDKPKKTSITAWLMGALGLLSAIR